MKLLPNNILKKFVGVNMSLRILLGIVKDIHHQWQLEMPHQKGNFALITNWEFEAIAHELVEHIFQGVKNSIDKK